jgi:hypothetical protein
VTTSGDQREPVGGAHCKREEGDIAGGGPDAGDANEEADLAVRVVAEPVLAQDDELSDAYAFLASLLLDLPLCAAPSDGSPPPMCAQSRPDAQRQTGPSPPPMGAAA